MKVKFDVYAIKWTKSNRFASRQPHFFMNIELT